MTVSDNFSSFFLYLNRHCLKLYFHKYANDCLLYYPTNLTTTFYTHYMVC